MAENLRNAADAAALANIGGDEHLRGDAGLPFGQAGGYPYYVWACQLVDLLDRMLLRSANALRVYQDSTDGDLECSVYVGRFAAGATVVTYAGSLNNTLTNNATNYLYLTAAGVLTINTTGFPSPAATPHVPLATVKTGSASAAAVSGLYDPADDIADYRDEVFLSVVGPGGEQALVEANTAGVGAPNVLTAAESGKTLTNEGCTAKGYHTLPTAVAGLTYTFTIQDTDGMRIVAGAADTIRLNDEVSIATGYIDSTTIGSSVTLLAVNATEWIAVALVGTWAVETS